MELKNKCEAIERREAERRAVDERKRKEEIDFLKPPGADFFQRIAVAFGVWSGVFLWFRGLKEASAVFERFKASAAAPGVFPEEPRHEMSAERSCGRICCQSSDS